MTNRYTAKILWSEVTEETKKKIIEAYSNGGILSKIVEQFGINLHILYQLRDKDPSFSQALSSAQEAHTEARADSLLSIVEEYDDVNKARLMSDNTKWLLARRAAPKYGDRIGLDINNNVDLRGALTEARQRIPRDVTQHTKTNDIFQLTATDKQSVDDTSQKGCEPLTPEEFFDLDEDS